jgi:hypothetical protein
MDMDYILVIPATWEAETKKMKGQGQSWQNVHKTLSKKKM